jgi:hypothetical protein
VSGIGADTEQLRKLSHRPTFRVMEHDGDAVGGRELAKRGTNRELIFDRHQHDRGIADVGQQQVRVLEIG